MQNRKLPSFFLTRTTFEEYGPSDSRIAPESSISSRCMRTYSNKPGGILLYGSLKGVSSVSLILCLTKSVFPRSVGPLENMSDHLLRTDLALEKVDLVSDYLHLSEHPNLLMFPVSVIDQESKSQLH